MQRKYLNYLGIEQGKDTPVLTNEAGVRMEANNLSRWWCGFREDDIKAASMIGEIIGTSSDKGSPGNA